VSTWESELREHFPGYLLPSSGLVALPREAAERFLARLTGEADALKLLLAASALAPVAHAVREFAKELPLAARTLPSRTEVERVETDGHVRGRPDVPGTLRKKLAGEPSRVVSRVPKRNFDLPENVLLVVTAHRLVELLARLEQRGVVAKDTSQGWAAGFRACAEKLRHALTSTVLRDVSQAPIAAPHEQAARAARHPAYGLALRIHEAMKHMDAADDAAIARIIAEGALSPLDAPSRFELAVLIRLGRSIERALTARGYTMSRALIERDRSHVFEFSSGGSCLRIHYNQVLFKELGPRDRGMRHYFDERGRFRPDLTVEYLQNEKRTRAVIVEVKLSDDTEYLKQGYHEALLYRAEYAGELTGWPKAILVVSSEEAIRGASRREDEVVAVGWKSWVPDDVLGGLLEGFTAAPVSASSTPSA
jgi:hypothetical protein